MNKKICDINNFKKACTNPEILHFERLTLIFITFFHLFSEKERDENRNSFLNSTYTQRQ